MQFPRATDTISFRRRPAEETEEERKQRRRDECLLLFWLLFQDTEASLFRDVDDLVIGTLNPNTWGRSVAATLLGAHSHAAYIGRRLAGSNVPFGQTDLDFGASIMDQQQPFLEGFISDLWGGRYTEGDAGFGLAPLLPAPVKRRVQMYAVRLRGTGNEAWTVMLPNDTAIYWDMLEGEDHCENCPELQASSPYTPLSIPTFPGAGDTQCMFNCKCSLHTEYGLEAFPILEY